MKKYTLILTIILAVILTPVGGCAHYEHRAITLHDIDRAVDVVTP